MRWLRVGITYRPYQSDMHAGTVAAWDLGASNVLLTGPTGCGKTTVFAGIIADVNEPTVAIAHRQELVSQMSLTLARNGIKHRIIAPDNVVRMCVRLQLLDTGNSYYDPKAPIAAAGVDTIVRRSLPDFFSRVRLTVVDEAHHVLRENKWGKAVAMFPKARGLGVTATPERADGQGLGRWASGIYDTLVNGPNMGDLILQGHLTPFRIFAPKPSINRASLAVGGTGDFTMPSVVAETRKSRIVGDIVASYLQHAPGKLGITFLPDIETAEKTAEKFKAAGVPAAAISSKTPDLERYQLLRALESGELMQLVNVDIFGEGFDLPAIEVCSFGRATASYPLFVQQFGRPLRPAPHLHKTHAIIIDHVDNVLEHANRTGLPTTARNWSLDDRDARARSAVDPDLIPQKRCTSCTQPYEAFHKACPFCGAVPIPAQRSGPEFVDGDITELDIAAIDAMHAKIAEARISAEETYRKVFHAAGRNPAMRAYNQQQSKHEALDQLRDTMALWAGAQESTGIARGDERYRLFYLRYGLDVLSAQALKADAAQALTQRLITDINKLGYSL